MCIIHVLIDAKNTRDRCSYAVGLYFLYTTLYECIDLDNHANSGLLSVVTGTAALYTIYAHTWMVMLMIDSTNNDFYHFPSHSPVDQKMVYLNIKKHNSTPIEDLHVWCFQQRLLQMMSMNILILLICFYLETLTTL